MQEKLRFTPARRNGTAFHIGAIVLLAIVGIAGLWASIQSTKSSQFLLLFIPSLLIISSLLFFIYFAYALHTAYYLIERDGIRLHWGLRREDIPISEILWVHPADDLETKPPLPFLRLPGAVLGTRRLGSGGEIEYMAAATRNLLVIARLDQAFVISPTDPAGFIHAYQRFTEMGSFIPFEPVSIYPASFLNQVWKNLPARFLILFGALSCIALFTFVSFGISSNSQVYLRILAVGASGEPVPAIRLLLLPLLNTFIFLVDLFIGLYFYLDPKNRHLAFLLWGTGLVTSFVFTIGVYFIINAP